MNRDDLTEKELRIANDWLFVKCPQCTERPTCFSKENKKKHEARIQIIDTLGFCEDYIVDSTKLKTDRRQVCHEEVTFDELYNKGEFPIDDITESL